MYKTFISFNMQQWDRWKNSVKEQGMIRIRDPILFKDPVKIKQLQSSFFASEEVS